MRCKMKSDVEQSKMSSTPSDESTLSYQLPPIVESIRSGWLSTFGRAVTISGLLTVVEASLVAFFKNDQNFSRPQSGVQEAILILTYAAIIFSTSATISALTLTDELGEIPSRASRDPLHTIHPAQRIEGNNWDILRHFGARKSTRWVTYHWSTCLLLASLCAIASITVYAATQGARTLIIISITTGAATLPPLCQFFIPL